MYGESGKGGSVLSKKKSIIHPNLELSIFIRIKERDIPALHILMTAKSEQIYVDILTVVRDLVPEFRPTFVMYDIEKASQNACISIFSG